MTTQNHERSHQRWVRKEKTIKGFVSLMKDAFKMATDFLCTSEALWAHRSQYILTTSAYVNLPYADKRYLDGVWDTLNSIHESQYVWTHVLDGERFQNDDPAWCKKREGREHQIDTDLSYFCHKRTLDGQTIFIPVREKDRDTEFQRDPCLADKVARLLPGAKRSV